MPSLAEKQNYSHQAKRLRATLTTKGNNPTIVAHSRNNKVRARKKTGKDILRAKVQSLKNKYDVRVKLRKQRRARKLRSRGINA